MSYLVRPDHTEGAGQGTKTASGALLYIKGGALSLFIEGAGKADQAAACLLAMMA